jgi:hypothetical protein
MKKTLLTLAFSALAVCASFAQGTVNFNNTATTFSDGTTVDRFVYNVGGQTRLTGVNYSAALYWGTSADAITSLAVLNPTDVTLASAKAAFRASTTTLPGTWTGGGSRTLLGTTGGQTVFLQVRVWDHTLFATYDLAKAGGGITGQSGSFSYTISTSPTPPPSDLVMANLRRFDLVPEPSTIALGVLGLGSLLLFRRKK